MSQRETHVVEESWQELFEDHLRVALIKPGDSVIIIKKVVCLPVRRHTIRVEPR